MFGFISKFYLPTAFLLFIYYMVLNGQPKLINGVSVPGDFPEFIVTLNNNPSPGKIFTSNTSGNGYYVMIFENDGTPYYYKKVNHYSTDFKVQPNGMLSRYSPDDGGFITIDNNFETTAVYKVQNGHGTDEHDFLITPEGTFLMIGITSEYRDMSVIVPGGNINANIIGNVIQELDVEQNLLFEWNASNYFDITDAIGTSLTSSRIDWIHMNSIALDYDGNILISSRHLSECTKIDRQTGEIIWRLGGNNNEFTFLNENLEFSFQHAFYPVEGKPGNYTIYDNGNNRGEFSRVVEYKITINGDTKTAEKVWEFRSDPDFYTHRAGNAQRLPNGNTLINLEQPQYPKAIEVTPGGEILYEANFSPQAEAHKTFRFEWEGIMNAPYLLSEPLSGSVRLLFNKFGDINVLKYKIYGGAQPDNLVFISETNVTWADIDLKPFAEYEKYFFGVKSVSNEGTESEYSNMVEVQLGNLFIGQSNGILGNSIDIEVNDPQWRDSQPGFGSSLFFDGVDDFVNCGNDNSLQISGHQLTLEAWINPAEFKSNSYEGVIISKVSFILGQNNGYTLACGDNGTVYFSIGDGILNEVTTSAGTISIDQWNHVAGIFDGNALKIYINGQLAGENVIGNTAIGNAASYNLRLGSSSFYNNRSYAGLIDEVRIWNVARSQSEILNSMNSQINKDIYSDGSLGLKGYWQFNENSGQTTEDLAVDNNLILNGDFSNGDNYWAIKTERDGDVNGYVDESGRYFLDIINGGSYFGDIQLYQGNIWLIKDNLYTLKFDAWVDNPRIIYINILQSKTPYINYGKIGAAYITPSKRNYEFNFQMEENSDNSAMLYFQVGSSNFDIAIDNVRLTADITSGINEDDFIPTSFELFNNYPNPFNPSTTIEYYLPETSNVEISVYNILGEKVSDLNIGIQNKGNHKFLFNGTKLSSAVYIYILSCTSLVNKYKFSRAKKMILLK